MQKAFLSPYLQMTTVTVVKSDPENSEQSEWNSEKSEVKLYIGIVKFIPNSEKSDLQLHHGIKLKNGYG